MPPIRRPELTVVRDQAPGQFYTLTYCAHKCGVMYDAFRKAQKAGVIPIPFYTNPSGHQLLTFGQMEAIIHTYRAWRRREIKRSEIRSILDKHWND